MSVVAFKPNKIKLNTTNIPLIDNITLQHFPMQSVIELTDIVGFSISVNSHDETGVIKISGSVQPTSGVSMPGCEHVLMLTNTHVKSNPIYLGVNSTELEEVGRLVEECIVGNQIIVVESEIAIQDAEHNTIASIRRTFTAANKDVVAYFFKFTSLREEFIEMIQAGNAQNPA